MTRQKIFFKLSVLLIVLASLFFIFTPRDVAWGQSLCCVANDRRVRQCFCISANTPNQCQEWAQEKGYELWGLGGIEEVRDSQACASLCHTRGCQMEVEAAPTPEPEIEDKSLSPMRIPILQVPIPGLIFTADESVLRTCIKCKDPDVTNIEDCPPEKCANWRYSIPWIGEYIAAFYKWAIGALAVLAVIMIMISGLRWIIAGNSSEKISSARQGIVAAVSGLLLILIVHQVLAMINPELTILKPIVIGGIERISPETIRADPDQEKQERATGRLTMRSADKIKKIYIHYSGTSVGDVEVFRRSHTTEKRFGPMIDVGYHYVILNGCRRSGQCKDADDGLIERGRNELAQGAHAKGCNHNSIGIAFVSNKEGESFRDSMTEKQLSSLKMLVNQIRERYNIDDVENVLGHNECPGHGTNSCPGFIDMDEFRIFLEQ